MRWFRRKPDPEVEAARAELESVLPPGWTIDRSDRERFSLFQRGLVVWAAWASCEAEHRYAIAFGRSEADAFRQVARRLRRELEPTLSWRPPIAWSEKDPRSTGLDFRIFAPDQDYSGSLADLKASLPVGWDLYFCDRERFAMPGHTLETHGCSAKGPEGEAIFTMGIGADGSLRALQDALEGRLAEASAWAPRFDRGI